MSAYEKKNAIIENAIIDIGERGLLTAWIYLKYDGGGQGFGGYALHLPSDWKNGKQKMPFAGHFLTRVLQVVGVDKWEQLPGKAVRVVASDSDVSAIGNIIKEDWFNPRQDFGEIRKVEEMEVAK